MADRELYYGDPDSESPRYRVRDTDPETGGDYVIERLDTNGGVVDTPLRIDDAAGALDLSALPTTVGTLNGADIETASAGDVPVAQGDGTLAMTASGGVTVRASGTTTDRTAVASLGTARQRLAAASADGLVYAIGGNSSANTYESVVEEYDPATDTWTAVASLGTARQRLAAASADGLVYAIGGNSSANFYESVVEEYDPATDTWTAVASLGTARRFLAAASADGLVYAIGGNSSANTYESVVEESQPGFQTVFTADSGVAVGVDSADAEFRVGNGTIYKAGDTTIALDGDTVKWRAFQDGRLFTIE